MADTPAPQRRGCLFPIVLFVLVFSLLANLVLAILLIEVAADRLDSEDSSLEEKFMLGDRDASDKVAVVKLDGLISESGIGHPIKQLEAAAKDRHVKAVVLRVDSPGGTVTATDELYQSLINLRDNTNRRFRSTGPKPIVVSMGGLATSGGYYIAVAGSPILAERTTITGSIGVFAALPNIAKFGEDHGLKLELIKAGSMKASGSFFHSLSPQERQTWQDTVDSAYGTFLQVIETGRPKLTREKLTKEVVIDRQVPERDDKGDLKKVDGKDVMVAYKRIRADGATFTAEQAKSFDLIDDIGDLPAAVKIAAEKVGLKSYRAVTFAKPPTLLNSLTGMQAGAGSLDLGRLGSALTPRMWYLAPTADGAILAEAKP